MTQSLTYVEIDIPAFVQNSPPDSPMPEQTFRFTTDVAYLPNSIDAIPSIRSVNITPGIISLGGDLGQRASVEVLFKDHKHIFASESFDSGTFWGKFRGRYGLKLRGFPLRVIRGVVGDALQDMETRHFIIESTDGPTTKGEYKIVAKDVLKFADGDRAQAPALSQGFLIADINASVTTFTLSPSGIGDLDYPGTGYVAVGGSEIMEFSRFGIDQYDVLLIHGDGNSPTSIVDALTPPKTITVVGNTTASASQSKFGGASVFFDGTGDYLTLDGSSDFAFGTNDFCIDFWVRMTAGSGTIRNLYDSRPSGTNGIYVNLYVTTANVLAYFVNSVDRIIGTTALSLNTWYHVAVARHANVTKLFLNGVQESGNYTDTNSYLNGSSRPAIGSNGNTINTQLLTGYIDELKVTNGKARFNGTFTVPTVAYSEAGSGDILNVIRAQYNTTAETHTAGDRVQTCVEYLGQDVADIIYDLLTTYSNIDPDFITLANWQTETGTYLNTLYSALIAEPTAVNDLVSELIEQASLVVWWDDINQQVRLQVLRAVSTVADIYNEDNMMMNSLQVKEQPAKRISQVYTYFNKINPLVKEDQIDNYGSSAFAIDAQSETDYGSAAIKKIFSRWIPEGGRAVADNVNDILLARFVTPPRLISFDILRYSGVAPALGLGYQIMGWPFQDETGAADMVPAQIVRLNPKADVFEVEVEEVFAGATAAPDSPDNHVIIIDASTLNVNLRSMHDSLYAEATSGITVTCTILDGVIVGSSTTASPAFDVGSWASGVIIDLIVIGRIQGKGGAGGAGHDASSNPGLPGAVGGIALYTRKTINLTSTNGEIWGGGGGGGGGGSSGGGGGGGGGGAGTNIGAGGAAGTGFTGNFNGFAGNAGTSEAGGSPGGGGNSGFSGGVGGGPGLAGSVGITGSSFAGGAGGAAGSGIDGDSFVTDIGGVGDIRGPQVN